MIQKIKQFMTLSSAGILMAMSTVAMPVIGSTVASAECSHIAKQISDGANAVGGDETNCDTGDTGIGGTGGITKLGKKIVNLISVIVGVVAIIMIIVGGFRYITSGGDSNRVGGAKNTLIYAIIGLIIVALAQVIVHFVLTQTASVGPS